MSPRIVRPRSDKPHWVAATVGAAAALTVGFMVGVRLFDPGTTGANAVATVTNEVAPSEGELTQTERQLSERQRTASGAIDGGMPSAASHGSNPVGSAPPSVPVRVVHVFTQSCGDGEELNIPGVRCEPVPALEEALRRHLLQLGNCPSAETNLRPAGATLSVGLRVDFARRRVTPLPGRSSTVSNALAYVACARAVMERAEDLWQIRAPHVRYLLYFTVRLGPPPVSASDTTVAVRTERPSVVSSGIVTAGTEGTDTLRASSGSVASVQGVPLARPERATLVWDGVLLRASPRDGAVLARLSRGEQVTVLARLGTWWQVRHRDRVGWIYGEAIGR